MEILYGNGLIIWPHCRSEAIGTAIWAPPRSRTGPERRGKGRKMSVNMLMTNLDLGPPTRGGLYNNTQENILKGQGRAPPRHVFLRFTGDAARSRGCAAGMASQATSFAEQYCQTQDF